MDRRAAAALAYSCAAIYVIVTAIVQIGYAAQSLGRAAINAGQDSDSWSSSATVFWTVFLPIGLPLLLILGLLGLLAWGLIAGGDRLAARLFPVPASAPPAAGELTVSALHLLAFHVIGLIVLCFVVPDLIYLLTDAWRNRDDLNPWIAHQAAPLAGALVQLGAGYVLFFFPGAALRLWSLLGGRMRAG